MKKYISLGLGLILGASVLKAQESGVFVGVFGGTSLNSSYIEGQVNAGGLAASSLEQHTNFNLIYGARLGYIAAFTERQALRFYADFTGGEFKLGEDPKTKYNMQVGGGIDYILSFNKFGIFIGGGYNYAFGDFIDALKIGFNNVMPHQPYVNCGFAWNVSLLRLELGTKIPILKYAQDNYTDPITGANIKYHINTPAQIYFNVDFVF